MRLLEFFQFYFRHVRADAGAHDVHLHWHKILKELKAQQVPI
jgi:hypothetical protein